MARFFLIVLLMICSFLVKAQQINVKETKRGLQATFAAPVLAAYQTNAQNKIEDLYQYLQLLSDTTVSDSLKKEIEDNIYTLFKGRDVTVPNIISDNKSLIKLSLFIEQLKKQPFLKFKLVNIENGAIDFSSWQMSYTVKVLNNNDVYSFTLRQKVFLTKEAKAFGNTIKEVWQVHLGEIQ